MITSTTTHRLNLEFIVPVEALEPLDETTAYGRARITLKDYELCCEGVGWVRREGHEFVADLNQDFENRTVEYVLSEQARIVALFEANGFTLRKEMK